MNKSKLDVMYTAIKKINSLCALLSGLILLFITFSIFIDVILRYFFNRPSIWITEICTYLFLYMIFLGTSYALQMDFHIRVTFLINNFPNAYARWFDRLTSILCIVFSAVLLWQTSVMTWVSFSEKWTTPTMLGVPYAWIYVVMVFGSAFLLLTFILRTALQFLSQNND